MRHFAGDIVFDPCQDAEFAFHGDVVLVCILHDLAREFHVLLVRVVRAVDHDGREAGFHAGLAQFERIAVVQVEDDRDGIAEFVGVVHCPFGEVFEQGLVGVLARAAGDLEEDRGFGLNAGADDGLQLFQIVEVECRDGISTLHGLLKKLF